LLFASGIEHAEHIAEQLGPLVLIAHLSIPSGQANTMMQQYERLKQMSLELSSITESLRQALIIRR